MSGRAPVAISVVTPFYNTAKYLDECIRSVLAQTVADFEYILLDNCSTDGSRAIADAHAARDPRLRVLQNERLLPQVANYNRALTLLSPSSQFCKIVQADDVLLPRCLEEMVGLAAAHPSIAVVSAFRLDGPHVWPAVGPPFDRPVMTGREACRRMLVDNMYLFGSPTTTLVRSDVIRARSPFYVEGHYFEDAEVMYEILRDRDFGFVQQILTYSRPAEPGTIWATMADFGPIVLSRLIQLKGYGPIYLTPEENARLVAKHERVYYELLADGWLRRRDRKFWEFHEKWLAEIGMTIDWGRVMRAAAPVVLDLSPARLGRAVWRRASRFLRR